MKKIRAIEANRQRPDGMRMEESKLRVCAYCRVSKENIEQSESLENQIAYYEEHIKSKSEWGFAGIYADYGISGSMAAKRTEFNNMISDCKRGKIDLIITKSVSRLARNTADCVEVIKYLRNLNIGIYFEREHINTLVIESELLLSILSSIAQEELRSMSENIKWSFKKKFEEGRIQLNSIRFLGYDLNNEGVLVINESEAEIVKRIYREYICGKSMAEIKRSLEKEGVKTVTGKDNWQENTIRGILMNEKYYGDLILQKTVTVDYITHKRKKNEGEAFRYLVKNHHDPIVSKEEFDRVQKIRTQRAAEHGNTPKIRNKYNNRYVFSGKIVCGSCGAVFKRRTWNSKASCKQIVWQCSTYIKEGKSTCSMKAVDDSTLKVVFTRAFNGFYENKNQRLYRSMKNRNKGIGGSDFQNIDTKVQIEEITGKIKELVRLQIKGKISEDDFEKEHAKLKSQLNKLKKSQLGKPDDNQSSTDIKFKMIQIENFFKRRDGMLEEFDDEVFKALVERVVVKTPTHICFELKNGIVLEEKFIKKRGKNGLV